MDGGFRGDGCGGMGIFKGGHGGAMIVDERVL